MRKICILLISLLCITSLNATDSSLLWQLFQKSAKSSASAIELHAISKNFNEDSQPILIGYRGISNMMLCNYYNNPVSKLSHFKEGKKWLDLSIKKDSNSVELKFFRFTCQVNTPAILGYKSNINSDKLLLINYLIKNKNLNQEIIYQNIFSFLISCDNCSKEEKKLLLNLDKCILQLH